jgi:hypothetical protein
MVMVMMVVIGTYYVMWWYWGTSNTPLKHPNYPVYRLNGSLRGSGQTPN